MDTAKKGDLRLLPRPGALWRPVIKCFEKLTALEPLERAYRNLPRPSHPAEFVNEALRALGVRPVVLGNEEAPPSSGPVLVVANHPFGGLEGLLAAWLLLDGRPDVKIMANALLEHIPELAPVIIGVDPFGRRKSTDRNVVPLRRCVTWLKDGGALVMFPSGTVSHFHVRKRRITDPPWSPTVGRLVLWSRCSVVPMYFDGANSLLFQLLGLFHPRLRTLLLARELHNKRGHEVRLTVGRTIPFEELKEIGSPDGITEYLRAHTYALGISQGSPRRKISVPPWRSVGRKSSRASAPIGEAVCRSLLLQDMGQLDPAQCVLQSGAYRVWYAEAAQIPNILQEIGRLRETAFRDVGEGTGRSLDLDRFDRHYEHLFLWNEQTHEIVGAYRIGRGDRLLGLMGLEGFYTHTLFKYEAGIRPLLKKSLELGRSFVRPEYQKTYAPLWFLWKGIGRYAARHERYRFLLGPVSISDAYHVLSRHLILMYLRHNHFSEQWARWVRARRPWRRMPSMPWNARTLCRDLADLDLFSELIAAIEKRERTLPVLLRQYIKLGGKVLGFNVDPDFSDVLDALVVVDLALADPLLLEKTMGREAAHRFLRVHQGDFPLGLPLCA
uniref:Lysophospholipid acyltransferase family protein n=1 Tax=Desulfacinum infernum TaxID=35837 RepID=A0A831ZZ51_9BACT